MKKEILGAVLLMAAASAMATQFCSGANQASSAAVSSSEFVVTDFTARCSANVILHGDDNTTFYTVAAASVKGKNTFNGTTQGGAVAPYKACAATGCSSTEVGAALTAASSTGSSSST